MGTNAVTLHRIPVDNDGRPILAPLDQYNPYPADTDQCRVCAEPRSAMHAIGCIHGDSFQGMRNHEARDIAAERIDQAGGRIADDFLNEFHLATTNRDIVVDDVLHAVAGNRVLVRHIGLTADDVFLISMVTGDVLRVPRLHLLAATVGWDGRLIEAGTLVEHIGTGERGRVKNVTPIDLIVLVKGDAQFGVPGHDLRVLDEITLRWETTVVESHHENLPLVDVAEALGIDTNGKTPDETRQEVQAATGLYAEIHIGTGRRLRNLDAMLCEVEIDPVHRDNNCHPSTESRVLLGHGEG